MKAAFYPSLEEALHLHALIIERYGGQPGVRDPGLLESALHRPRSGYYETLARQAAALLQSLCRNHAFVDGNKRVAFALTTVFLRLNGYRWVVDAQEGERFIVEQVIGSGADVVELARWIEARLEAHR